MRRGARPADRQGRGRRGHRGRAQLLRGRRASGRRQGLRESLRPGAKDLQPEPRAHADEAQQPEQGTRRRPGLCADLMGRSVWLDQRAAEPDPRRRPARRVGLSPRGRQLWRRRHAAVVYGHVSGVPGGLGSGGLRPGLGAGRQVLPLRTFVRRVLASRFHRRRRHAAVQLPDLVRLEHRSIGRRGRRLAPCQGARARHEARAGRTALVGHRCLLGAMGADQAQDRRGVSVRADPCAAA